MAKGAKGDAAGNAAAMAFNFTSAVGIILANKVVFKEYGFSFPTAMTVLHFAMTTLGVQLLLVMGFFKPKPLKQLDVLPVTVSFCSFVVFNNLSLQANTVGTYQLMKVMTTPVVVALQYLIFQVSLPMQLVLSLAPICVGVALATVSDVGFTFEGLVWGALGVLATCFYQLFVKSKQSELGCSFFQLLYYQAPQAMCVVMVMTPFLDKVTGEDGLLAYSNKASVEAVQWIVLSAVMAFLVNLSTYLVITRTSPVTYQVLGHFKLGKATRMRYPSRRLQPMHTCHPSLTPTLFLLIPQSSSSRLARCGSRRRPPRTVFWAWGLPSQASLLTQP
mmetsp:Transcript_23751/g.74698  ORF Transcript_23751/g.74698 Transcript_23751/m.74698 type:complete len:332 (-) Transcript_23751:531-1526(-)